MEILISFGRPSPKEAVMSECQHYPNVSCDCDAKKLILSLRTQLKASEVVIEELKRIMTLREKHEKKLERVVEAAKDVTKEIENLEINYGDAATIPDDDGLKKALKELDGESDG